MTASTCKKLSRLGYSEEFIESIICFRKDTSKRFILRVTDIESLSDSAKDGEFICYASFSTLEELREIVDKLEGFAYEEYGNQNLDDVSASIIDEGMYEIYEELINKEEI